MRKITLALLTLMVAAVLPFITQSTSHAASYKTVCEKGSGTSSGRCYKQRSAVVKKVRVVDAVPLINRSSKRVTMTCNFSSTITKEITAGGSASVTTSAEASFMKIAKASVSATYTLHASVRMSSAQAKSAGGTVTLKPGEKVVCQRIYSHVVFSVQPYTYSGTKIRWQKTRSVTVPSTLGVRIVD